MTPRGRTNQLLYQAELLLATPSGEDEHAASRRMALEEGTLALLELALEAALREVTEHAYLARHDWRELLQEDDEPIAELERLRELAGRPGSWLAVLIARLEALRGVEGAARRDAGQALIASADRVALADELRWCLGEFKELLFELRETSAEW
ncbi:hypothetical protein SAMN02745148_02677 [Modicisalibacter ilicicola DSM 19980]|uniref:Uncharacterized protein n=1 Tax=Modicisalibacter ilicicola DSM 19980 TaxID=1121942 RepID=A0A1M5BU23_9GAMM|nr:DUF6586 family protein [Halomonas ilicicola]SHF45767.1 hypothetical protein SAMN02745148_02677 [Halomonas ilicicola DSM 19980]